MTINPNVRYTYQDYINLPESENKQYELIDGELYMAPSPTPKHQRGKGNLFRILSDHVEANDLGVVYDAPLDVVLSNEDVLQPDIMFISKKRLGIVTEQNIQGAPDLVIEVLSPGTASRDRTIKRARYARFGVREYWLVDLVSRTIEVLRASREGFETIRIYSEGMSLESPLLPGLQIDVASIFA